MQQEPVFFCWKATLVAVGGVGEGPGGRRQCFGDRSILTNHDFPFLFVLPCGRLFLENNYFPLCLCCPAGGLDFEKSCFLYLYDFLHIAKLPNLLGFEPREYARTLSFEKICRMH